MRAERPDYSLYGEEHGVVGPANATTQWVVDPIDGTSNFVRGVPVWATLIALVHEGEPVLGVVSAPALGMRLLAARGLGAHHSTSNSATMTAQPIRVSDVSELRRASASITVPSRGTLRTKPNNSTHCNATLVACTTTVIFGNT